VANARKLRLIYANKRKTDEIDAENLARLARLDPKLLYPLKHRGEDSQAQMALIRSCQALVGCRRQLVNHVRGRSSPSEEACPSARPGASTTRHPSTSPRHSGRLLGPSWSRDRLAYGAHQGLREAAGEDLQGALYRNRSLASGRGDRDAQGAHLRAHVGRSLPHCKEPQRGCLFSGAGARQGSVGRWRIAPVHYYSAAAFCFARRTGRFVNTMLARSILCGGIYLGAPSAH
jgi:hypothetical protein